MGRSAADRMAQKAAARQAAQLAAAIAKHRRELGLSRRALAAKAKIREGTIRALEEGRTRAPSLWAATRIADALGTDLHALLAVGESPPPVAQAKEPPLVRPPQRVLGAEAGEGRSIDVLSPATLHARLREPARNSERSVTISGVDLTKGSSLTIGAEIAKARLPNPQTDPYGLVVELVDVQVLIARRRRKPAGR